MDFRTLLSPCKIKLFLLYKKQTMSQHKKTFLFEKLNSSVWIFARANASSRCRVIFYKHTKNTTRQNVLGTVFTVYEWHVQSFRSVSEITWQNPPGNNIKYGDWAESDREEKKPFHCFIIWIANFWISTCSCFVQARCIR